MRTTISALAVTTLLAASSAVLLSPAVAASHYDKQDRYIQDFCHANPHAKDCNDWQSNRGHWNNDRYQSFYRNHQNDRVFNSPDVASIFGITINLGGPAPAPGPVVVNNDSHHLQACRAHFHTYDSHSDSYMGYDHQRHQCMY
jgi:hypothetical protein